MSIPINIQTGSISAQLAVKIGFHVSTRSHISTAGQIPFATIITNSGSNWIATSNQFVAPRQGTYVFNLAIYQYAATPSALVGVMHSGLTVQTIITSNLSRGSGSLCVVRTMTPGSYVYARLLRGKLMASHSHFSGFLLYEN